MGFVLFVVCLFVVCEVVMLVVKRRIDRDDRER